MTVFFKLITNQTDLCVLIFKGGGIAFPTPKAQDKYNLWELGGALINASDSVITWPAASHFWKKHSSHTGVLFVFFSRHFQLHLVEQASFIPEFTWRTVHHSIESVNRINYLVTRGRVQGQFGPFIYIAETHNSYTSGVVKNPYDIIERSPKIQWLSEIQLFGDDSNRSSPEGFGRIMSQTAAPTPPPPHPDIRSQHTAKTSERRITAASTSLSDCRLIRASRCFRKYSRRQISEAPFRAEEPAPGSGSGGRRFLFLFITLGQNQVTLNHPLVMRLYLQMPGAFPWCTQDFIRSLFLAPYAHY